MNYFILINQFNGLKWFNELIYINIFFFFVNIVSNLSKNKLIILT